MIMILCGCEDFIFKYSQKMEFQRHQPTNQTNKTLELKLLVQISGSFYLLQTNLLLHVKKQTNKQTNKKYNNNNNERKK